MDSDGYGNACDSDRDGDGYGDTSGIDDCPDNPSLRSPATWYRDADGDQYGDPADTQSSCSQPTGFVAVAGDLCPQRTALQAAVTYYVDADGDRYGSTTPASLCETSAPDGYSSLSTDCDDANPAIHTDILYFADQDQDTYGDSSLATSRSVCSTAPPAGFVANSLDSCPLDGLKIDPGFCGCGLPEANDDGDLYVDCVDLTPPLTLDAGKGIFTGDDAQQIVIDVQLGRQPQAQPSMAASVALRYDASRLAFVSVTAGQAGNAAGIFTEVIGPAQGAGTVVFGVGNSGGRSSSEPATVARVTFRALNSQVEICDEPGVVEFVTDGESPTRLVSASTTPIIPSTVDLDGITVFAGDALVGVPEGDSYGSASGWPRAADAGVSGSVFAEPSVTAFSPCDKLDPAVTLLITYPAGHSPATSTTWPANDVFPVGTTTVTWTAEFDPSDPDMTVSATRSFTVLNHALMSIDLSLRGVMPAHVRPIEYSIDGGAWQAVAVPLAASSGATPETYAARGSVSVQVPVGTSVSACVRVRDPIRSLVLAVNPSAGSGATVWTVSAALKQGDSNQDNVVDILDYGLWALDRGASSTNARSNFNANGIVDSVDFAFIAENFLEEGDQGCNGAGGNLAGSGARDRISVDELRAMGHAAMIPLDLNSDGWLDTEDMALWMQGIRPAGDAGSAGAAGRSAE
jgi:hypothetical protein